MNECFNLIVRHNSSHGFFQFTGLSSPPEDLRARNVIRSKPNRGLFDVCFFLNLQYHIHVLLSLLPETLYRSSRPRARYRQPQSLRSHRHRGVVTLIAPSATTVRRTARTTWHRFSDRPTPRNAGTLCRR